MGAILMRLQTKLFLAIIGLLVATVIAIAFAVTSEATQSMVRQTEENGIAIAQMLARSANFAVRVPRQVEDIVGDQMVVEARIAANLVSVAEGRAKMSPPEIQSLLRDITDNSVLSEFWITDEKGEAYLTNTGVQFTFSPDPREQPQAHIFYQLLGQKNGSVIQEARKREIDPRIFKYVGVSGVDKPRIVQLGYEADVLDQFSRDINAQELVNELTGQGNVASIRIVDAGGQDLAASSQPVRDIGRTLSREDRLLLDEALRSGNVRSALQDDALRVAVPLLDKGGRVQLVALAYLLMDGIRTTVETAIIRSLIFAVAVILVGGAISFFLSNGITRPISTLTGAARRIEEGQGFDPEALSKLASGKDEVARLTQVFARMAAQVQAREDKLKEQVKGLRIEVDQAKKARQIAEITETDYFQNLRKKAQELRRDRKEEG